MTADFSDGSKPGALTLLENLLRQVVLIADFLDLMKLRFDPIDVVLFVHDYMFEQLSGGVVVSIEAGFYSGPENRQRRLLQPEIVFYLLLDIRSDLDLS